MTASDSISIRPVHAPDEPLREGLASLLIDTVEGGASVGYLVPLERAQAAGYWRRVFEGLGPELLLWVAECAGRQVQPRMQPGLQPGYEPSDAPRRRAVNPSLPVRIAGAFQPGGQTGLPFAPSALSSLSLRISVAAS